MKKILIASNNQGKINEIKKILKGYDIISLKEAGIDIDVPETGQTFIENATIKATEISKLITNNNDMKDAIVLADDSGLSIDYLNGAPGVYSARWMPNKNDFEVNEEVLKKLSGVEDSKRTARFTTVIVCILPNKEIISTEGNIEGYIAHKQMGTEGFAYDPIFYVPHYKCTLAQMTINKKNNISHRGIALKNMAVLLNNISNI